MDINIKTTITLSPDDIKKIISNYLETKGYETESIRFQIETVCHDPRETYGTEELKGAKVEANVKNKNEEI